MAWQALVFDCDGVLLDSVPVKSNAFARLAEPYGQQAQDMFRLYHRLNGGTNRQRKFEWFFREYLHREITAPEREEWSRIFAAYVKDELETCPMIPGALATLQTQAGRLPLYVCSGAPAQELRQLLQKRGLDRYFAGIYGAPPGKSALLAQIINDALKIDPADALMIGDANLDRMAAEECGAGFYGVGPELAGGSFPWSADLLPFNQWLAEHED